MTEGQRLIDHTYRFTPRPTITSHRDEECHWCGSDHHSIDECGAHNDNLAAMALFDQMVAERQANRDWLMAYPS